VYSPWSRLCPHYPRFSGSPPLFFIHLPGSRVHFFLTLPCLTNVDRTVTDLFLVIYFSLTPLLFHRAVKHTCFTSNPLSLSGIVTFPNQPVPNQYLDSPSLHVSSSLYGRESDTPPSFYRYSPSSSKLPSFVTIFPSHTFFFKFVTACLTSFFPRAQHGPPFMLFPLPTTLVSFFAEFLILFGSSYLAALSRSVVRLRPFFLCVRYCWLPS